MDTCEYCHHPFQPNDDYCEHCGARLRQGQSSPDIKKPVFELPPSLGSCRLLTILGICAISLIVVGAFCGATWVSISQQGTGSQVVKVVTATPTATFTNTPGPSSTPTVTSTPTATQIPTATNTPRPTTIPASTLPQDQYWLEDQLELVMLVAAIQPQALVIDLVLYNHSNETILFEVKPSMIRITSNLGHIVGPAQNIYGHFSPFSGFTGGSLLLEPGERIEIAKNAPFPINLADATLTHVTVEVLHLSRIERARWQVQIPH